MVDRRLVGAVQYSMQDLVSVVESVVGTLASRPGELW